jgi:RNA polymerase sigma factor (sigma-70 family)
MIDQSKHDASTVKLRLDARSGHATASAAKSPPPANIIRLPASPRTADASDGLIGHEVSVADEATDHHADQAAIDPCTVEVDEEFCELIRQVRAGSQEAATTLTRRYQHHVMLTARRMLSARLRAKFDSSDFVQAVWASFFAKCLDREEFSHPKHLVAYLVGMARRKVQLEVRQQITTKKRDLRRECPLKHAEQAASTQPRPSAEVIAREAWTRLLAGQPDHYQKMVHLRLQGHTLEEISSRLSVNERTVRRALTKMFRERIE